VSDLGALGAKGYTRGQVSGHGVHGHRMAGLADAPNVRLEILASASLAARILERIAQKYDGQPIVAYVHEVSATPREHFV